jgi:zinc protease
MPRLASKREVRPAANVAVRAASVAGQLTPSAAAMLTAAIAAAFAALLLLHAPTLRAQAAPAGAAPRETPPAPAAPKDFTVPAKHEFTLANGMHVTLVPYGRLPLATLSLDLRTGAIDESAQQVWLANLTADFLQQGTTSHPAAAVAEAVAGMGGALSIAAGADQTTIEGAVLGDSAAAFARLIADIVQHPSFPESEFPRLKNDRLRQLAIATSRPGVMAQERFAAQLYPDHPYGRVLPTADALKGYSAAQVRDFYAHNVGAARAHLYVVGLFNSAAVEQAIRDAFNGWAAGSPPTANAPTPRAERTVILIDRPGAVQSTIDLGLPVADPSQPDFVPLQVTDALLGGSFASRITSNIREQKGYTYSPFSTLDSKYHSTVWREGADVTTNVTGASLKEIFGEIDRLRTEAPTADEVRSIQNYLAGTFVLANSSQAGLARQFGFVDLNGLGDDYLTTFVHRVYAVTPADVQHMAQQYLDPNKMAIVVAGDKKTVADQVAPYGKIVQ